MDARAEWSVPQPVTAFGTAPKQQKMASCRSPKRRS